MQWLLDYVDATGLIDLPQVFMPLVQGVAWSLIVAGWRHWNKAAQFSGQSVGARIRRWWWVSFDG